MFAFGVKAALALPLFVHNDLNPRLRGNDGMGRRFMVKEEAQANGIDPVRRWSVPVERNLGAMAFQLAMASDTFLRTLPGTG